MKAFLLAAGRGTRLRPYTDTLPKCLIPIAGQPLLAIWLNLLEWAGIHQVLINLHHHASQVRAFLDTYHSRTGMTVIPVFEPQLLGSAGTLLKNREFVAEESDFWIIYADNLTNLRLSAMWQAHQGYRKMGSLLTMGLFRAPQPQACGIAELDERRCIMRFTEKPSHPVSNLANAGIFVANQDIFCYFPKLKNASGSTVLDVGYDLLPQLVGRMFGYPIDAYLRDIGTVEAYQAALREWPGGEYDDL